MNILMRDNETLHHGTLEQIGVNVMCKYCEMFNKSDKDIWVDGKFTPYINLWVNETRDNVKGLTAKYCSQCGNSLTLPKPLTLEELKERDGKLIWIQYIGKFFVEKPISTHRSEYGLYAHRNNSYVVLEKYLTEYGFNEKYIPLEYYGKTWTAYDRPPTKGDD